MKSYYGDLLIVLVLTGCVLGATIVSDVKVLPVYTSIAGGILGLWILVRLEGLAVYAKWITYPLIFAIFGQFFGRAIRAIALDNWQFALVNSLFAIIAIIGFYIGRKYVFCFAKKR